MDLIFKRYSDPLIFLSQLLSDDSFSAGITQIFEQINDEKMWEFYLHKIHDKTYDEFKNELENNESNNYKMTEADVETTVNKSRSILEKFIPDAKDGDKNGII